MIYHSSVLISIMSQTFTNNLIREEVEDESPANTKMQERFVKTWMTSFLETKNNVSKPKVWRDQDGEMFILGLLKEQRQEQAHKERVSQVEELEMWDDCLQNLNSRSLKSPWAVLEKLFIMNKNLEKYFCMSSFAASCLQEWSF